MTWMLTSAPVIRAKMGQRVRILSMASAIMHTAVHVHLGTRMVCVTMATSVSTHDCVLLQRAPHSPVGRPRRLRRIWWATMLATATSTLTSVKATHARTVQCAQTRPQMASSLVLEMASVASSNIRQSWHFTTELQSLCRTLGRRQW